MYKTTNSFGRGDRERNGGWWRAVCIDVKETTRMDSSCSERELSILVMLMRGREGKKRVAVCKTVRIESW